MSIYIHPYSYIYNYIYICMCVCVKHHHDELAIQLLTKDLFMTFTVEYLCFSLNVLV